MKLVGIREVSPEESAGMVRAIVSVPDHIPVSNSYRKALAQMMAEVNADTPAAIIAELKRRGLL